MRTKPLSYTFLVLLLYMLQGCSDTGFHLRKNIDLPVKYQQIQLMNLNQEHGLLKDFRLRLEEAGGELLDSATTKIEFQNYHEGRRVVAYTNKRRAREYLLFLRFDYTINGIFVNKNMKKRRHINVDRTFIYDANFALGKAEEETQIRQNLYKEASRLILLQLQYADN